MRFGAQEGGQMGYAHLKKRASLPLELRTNRVALGARTWATGSVRLYIPKKQPCEEDWSEGEGLAQLTQGAFVSGKMGIKQAVVKQGSC